MSLTSRKSKICLLILFLSTMSFTVLGQKDWRKLARVRNVYIEIPNPRNEELKAQTQIFKDSIERQLSVGKILITNNQKDADAIFSGGNYEVEITLDSDKYEPERPIYRFSLRLPSGEVIWETKFKFAAKEGVNEKNKFAAKKAAERFIDDFAKAKKKYPN